MSILKLTVKIIEYLLVVCAILASSTQGRSVQHKLARRGHEKTYQRIEFEREMLQSAGESSLDVVPRSFEHHARSRGTLEGFTHRRRGAALARIHAIRKRHNANSPHHEFMSKEEELEYSKSRSSNNRALTLNRTNYEFEVKEAQNSALCNYTVTEIPDPSPDQSRTPKKLYDVKCNHIGSRCQKTGSYCCIQTYSKIEVKYGNGMPEILKIRNGCVCSLTIPGYLHPHRSKHLKQAINE